MTNDNINRANTIVMILHAANLSDGVTFAKIIEKAHLIIPPQQLKEYLSSLQKNRLIVFQRGEQVYRTTYKGMRFLQTYNHTIANMEKEQDSSCKAR